MTAFIKLLAHLFAVAGSWFLFLSFVYFAFPLLPVALMGVAAMCSSLGALVALFNQR